jgi:hypothetical protein
METTLTRCQPLRSLIAGGLASEIVFKVALTSILLSSSQARLMNARLRKVTDKRCVFFG